jgi:hypothetical protein
VTLVFGGTPPQRFYARPGLLATLLQYRGKPVLLAELQGDQMGVSKKLLGSSTRVEVVRIGSFGLWLEGGKHLLIWEARPGEITQKERRIAGNVLIWTQGDVTFRLEGGLDKDQMLELGREITR